MNKVKNVLMLVMGLVIVVLACTTLCLNKGYKDYKEAYRITLNEKQHLEEVIVSKDNTIDEIEEDNEKTEKEFKEFQDQVYNMMNGDAYKFSIDYDDYTTYIYEGNGSIFGRYVTTMRLVK